MTTANLTTGTEAGDLLATLATHRRFLRHTLEGLSDEQLCLRSTVSQLCLGGIVKHVSAVEGNWVRFAQEGPSAMPEITPAMLEARARQFEMGPGDTAESVLAGFDQAAEATDALVTTTDLDATQPLPEAPWFPPGARWSTRRVILHLIAEIAQHAGHADILREAIDGQLTMG